MRDIKKKTIAKIEESTRRIEKRIPVMQSSFDPLLFSNFFEYMDFLGKRRMRLYSMIRENKKMISLILNHGASIDHDMDSCVILCHHVEKKLKTPLLDRYAHRRGDVFV